MVLSCLVFSGEAKRKTLFVVGRHFFSFLLFLFILSGQQKRSILQAHTRELDVFLSFFLGMVLLLGF